MNKSTILATLVGTLVLAACGPTGPAPQPPVGTPSAPANDESQRGAQALVGFWTFTSTAQSARSDTVKLSRVLDSSSSPGEYFVAGEDPEGNTAIGWYDVQDRTYVVASGPTSLTRFFEFPTIAQGGSVSGIMWFSYGNSTFSEDFPMVGKRVITSAAVKAAAGTTPVDRRTAEHMLEKAKAVWEQSKR